MKARLLDILRCPSCGGLLDLAESRASASEIQEGTLRCRSCAGTYPIEASIPRFAPRDNYSGSFGFQWNEFRRTQLDSHSGHPISRDRFFRQSGWSPAELRGRRVLDLGCGSGRFAEIALSTGAEVVAVDYSTAADACWLNLGENPRLHVLQGDVYRLPFAPQTFDYVYSFGVLQHTPDVGAAFRALAAQVAPGGSLAVDLYPQLRGNVLWPKYWLRPLTMRLPPHLLFGIVRRGVPWLLPVSRALARVPGTGGRLRYAVPVANYEGVLPLSPPQLREWAVLDTFDMLAPAHDHPQSVETLRRWFDAERFEQVDVYRRGLVIGSGRRAPLAASVAAAEAVRAHRGR
jgi:SAM-dependent methyltransferase